MSNTAAPSTTQVAEQLRYIQEEILEQVRLAKALLRNAPTLTRQRAESYWLPQLTMASRVRQFPAQNPDRPQ